MQFKQVNQTTRPPHGHLTASSIYASDKSFSLKEETSAW
jgi:hypothetical protein